MDDHFITEIRAQGYRMTPQRWLILNLLREAGCHRTPVEIYQQAKKSMPGITEATVYRTLNFLTDQGLILSAHVGSGQLVYEIAEHAHHHLICRACGKSREIDHLLLEELYKIFKQRTGFEIDSIHTTFFGLCPDCQEGGVKSSLNVDLRR